MRAIHRDEIRHVDFGMRWLRRLKSSEMDDFAAFEQHLKWPIRPSKARGSLFQEDARRQAGMSDDFIDRLKNWTEQ